MAFSLRKAVDAFFKSGRGEDIARTLIPGWNVGQPAEWAHNKLEQVKHLKGWVFSAVRAITRGVTSVPLRFYLVDEDGTEEEAPFSHPIRELFRKVNSAMTFRDLIDVTFVHLELTGDAYWALTRDSRGQPTEIWPLPSQYVKIVPGATSFVDHYELTSGTKTTIYKREDVVHFKYASPNDSFYGYSPLQAAAEAVDADESISFSQYRMFKYGLHPDQIVITLPDKLSRVEKKRMTKELHAAYGGRDKASRVFIEDSGVKINRDFIKPREMDYLDSSTIMRRKILGVYGVPEVLVGITEDVNRASSQTSEYVFSRYTIQPKLEYLDGVITEVLCPMFDPNLKAEFDSPVPKDEEKRTKAVVEQWDSGILTRNEARSELGYDALDGDQGDELKPQRAEQAVQLMAAIETPTEAVKQEPSSAEVDALLESIWNREDEAKRFEKVMLPNVTEAMMRGAGLEERRLRKQVEEDFPEWVRALAERSRVRWDETVGETTVKGLKATLAEGLAANDTGPQMAARVRTLFDETYAGRSTTIARTEVVSAANAGAEMAGKQAGMEKKRWIATLDEHTRPDHMAADGQVVGIDETFNVGGDSLRYPGDPNAPVEQIANCIADPDVKVLTQDGEKPIAEISPGDMVATHKGRWRRVPRVSLNRGYRGEIVVITTEDGVELRLTPEHRLLTKRGWIEARLLRVGEVLLGAALVEEMNLVCQRTAQLPLSVCQSPPVVAAYGDAEQQHSKFTLQDQERQNQFGDSLGLLPEPLHPPHTIPVDLERFRVVVERPSSEGFANPPQRFRLGVDDQEHREHVGRIHREGAFTVEEPSEICPAGDVGGLFLRFFDVLLAAAIRTEPNVSGAESNSALDAGESTATRFGGRQLPAGAATEDLSGPATALRAFELLTTMFADSDRSRALCIAARKRAVDSARFVRDKSLPAAQTDEIVHCSLLCKTTTRIVHHERLFGKFSLYNFAVDGDESFIVGGVASHNCRCTLSSFGGEEKAYYDGLEKAFRAFEWKLERKTEEDVTRYFRNAGNRTANKVLAHYAEDRAVE